MRVYVPATVSLLRDAVATGRFQPPRGFGFAVTPGLRQEYPSADTEDLEYLAMHDAAMASLRLIAAGGSEPVRVVLAIDGTASPAPGLAASPVAAQDRDDGAEARPTVTPRDDLDRAVVTLTGSVGWDSVAAVHLDGGEVAQVVRAAAAAVDAADLGDLDAAVVVGEAEDIDLAWYAPSEIGYLMTELPPS